MTKIEAKEALLETGWQQNVAIDIAPDGIIQSVTADHATVGPEAHEVLIPALVNVHSHAFQRALAGFAETRRAERDDFWSWRTLMYQLANQLSPEQVQVIASQLFIDIMKAGYGHVCEFHYLHGSQNDASGLAMSQALIEAANATGIGLTLMPVFYSRAGFEASGPEPHQEGFVLSQADYLHLLHQLQAQTADGPNLEIGLAFHSLRAAAKAEMSEILQQHKRLSPHTPVHIHIAEQHREVEECLHSLGKRPVEWLFDNFDVNSNWCLIHATHMVPHEVKMVAESGAVAGLCPTTEANLGDGIFPLNAYQNAGGKLAIGSDSQITVDAFDELRLLEYSNRLIEQRRLIGRDNRSAHSGAALYRQALQGGAQAAGLTSGTLAPGHRADLLSVDPHHPLLIGRGGDYLIDGLVFGGGQAAITDVMSAGQWRIRDHRHDAEADIGNEFRALMKELDVGGLIQN